MSVNVYGLLKDFQPPRIYPTYEVNLLEVTDDEKPIHFDLLLLKEKEKSHYTYISNFSKLVRSQITSHHGSVIFCKRCFKSFNKIPNKTKLCGQAELVKHKLVCGLHKPILPMIPTRKRKRSKLLVTETNLKSRECSGSVFQASANNQVEKK